MRLSRLESNRNPARKADLRPWYPRDPGIPATRVHSVPGTPETLTHSQLVEIATVNPLRREAPRAEASIDSEDFQGLPPGPRYTRESVIFGGSKRPPASPKPTGKGGGLRPRLDPKKSAVCGPTSDKKTIWDLWEIETETRATDTGSVHRQRLICIPETGYFHWAA